jgi:serine protease Do
MRKQVLLSGLGLLLGFLVLTGFATYTNDQPAEKKKPRAGWLGVSIRDAADMREEKKLSTDDGAYIVEVIEDSPADSIGLRKGDVVLEFGGRKIYDADDLAKSVSRTEPGTRVPVVVLRDGERKTFQVVVGKYPRRSTARLFAGPGTMIHRLHTRGMLGLSVLTLNEQLAKYFGAPNDEGVLVESVEKKSPAEKAGITAGDVILRVGSRSVNDIDDIWRGLEKFEEGDKVEIEVLRKGSKKVMMVELDEDVDRPWGHFIPPRIRSVPPIPEFHFEFDIEPELRKIERRLDQISPRIEREIREKVQKVTRSVSI